ncbi:hypothetical protein [Microbulbifer hydrolyticus]|uniref:DUF1496 domain-containing protein n=1 Tax=Microbulbifer hydrolyticus TaxID=48074 RepID=A0A6P1TCE0_9GAMM|nr:hypothetical protein [Microbulbifer hydrolyticus]MBB5210194.1 hypothetical protein [Microbulbifer hydrolyticus]QHQ39296.1 hypothetical protein GTQ55_10060 [Microbulbifer hydrolyticus]
MNRCRLNPGNLTLASLLSLIVVTAGAQTEDAGQTQLGGGQSPYLSFCQERFYEEDDGLIRCNWAVNFNYACFVSYPSNKVIQLGSKISEPEVVGECDNGERIIKILHY